jgi:hypothetical protein
VTWLNVQFAGAVLELEVMAKRPTKKAKRPDAASKRAKAKRKRSLTRIQKSQFRKRMFVRIETFLAHIEDEDWPVNPYRKLDVAFAQSILTGLRADFDVIKRKPDPPPHIHVPEGRGFGLDMRAEWQKPPGKSKR